MLDRADLTGVIIAIVSFLVGISYTLVDPQTAFVSGIPTLPLYLILALPIFSYATYWAFSIRRALAVRTYRRQALGIGSVVVAVFCVIAVFVVVPAGSTLSASFIQFVAFDILFLVLFYWIDASVLACRRSDPLLRDVLYWLKIRIPLWFAILVTTAIPILILGYIALTSNVALFNQVNNGTFGGPIVEDALNFTANFSIVILICGIIYLPASALRSKWDKNLRRHFLWFAPTAAVLLLIFFGPLSGSKSLASGVLDSLLLLILGYSLYRSAKALVPLNKIEPESHAS